MPPVIVIPNHLFRRMLLSLNALAAAWPGDRVPVAGGGSGRDWVLDTIDRLSFVQVDPVLAVERAHHHILFARNHAYRHDDLRRLLEEDRTLFENWSHDHAILPVRNYPYWKHYFLRFQRYEIHSGYRRYFAPVTAQLKTAVMRRITAEGPLKPKDISTKKVDWDDYFPKPSLAKLAMEYLWRSGELAVTRREGNEKVYDLAERVIPESFFKPKVSHEDYVDWGCRESLLRLGAATPAEIANFSYLVSKEDALKWCERQIGKDVIRVSLEDHGRDKITGTSYASVSLVESLPALPQAPQRLRLLNPFDPLIHDRRRTARVFGFDYTVEMWVPPKKRRYGYYVLPILEGERFTGRLDAKVDRRGNHLIVNGLWWEDGVQETPTRQRHLNQELRALARFAGVDCVTFAKGYLKPKVF